MNDKQLYTAHLDAFDAIRVDIECGNQVSEKSLELIDSGDEHELWYGLPDGTIIRDMNHSQVEAALKEVQEIRSMILGALANGEGEELRCHIDTMCEYMENLER